MSYYPEVRRTSLDMDGNELIDGDTAVVAGEIQAAIADITDSASGAEIETAVNSILAVLRHYGMIAEE